MLPVIWKVPGIGWEIPGYGLMLMIGFLASILWGVRRAERSKANADTILNCGFIALIGGVVGARLMYVLHSLSEFTSRGSALDVAWAMIDVRKGGLEVYGGVLAAGVGVLFYLWRWGHSIRWYMDIIAPSCAMGMAFGRIGCLLNGCCWGAPCDLPWAIRYPYASMPQVDQFNRLELTQGVPEQLVNFDAGGRATLISQESMRASDDDISKAAAASAAVETELRQLNAQIVAASDPAEQERLERRRDELAHKNAGLLEKFGDIRSQMLRYNMSAAEIRALAAQHGSRPAHPAQVYSAIGLFILAFLLSALYWRRTKDGVVISVFLIVEPISRWLLELVRADNPVDTFGVLTISQGIALGLIALGVTSLLALRSAPPRSPLAVAFVPPPENPPAVASASRR